MNTELNLTHSELVSELYDVLQPEPLFDDNGSLLNECDFKTLWASLENSDMNTLEEMYNEYC